MVAGSGIGVGAVAARGTAGEDFEGCGVDVGIPAAEGFAGVAIVPPLLFRFSETAEPLPLLSNGCF